MGPADEHEPMSTEPMTTGSTSNAVEEYGENVAEQDRTDDVNPGETENPAADDFAISDSPADDVEIDLGTDYGSAAETDDGEINLDFGGPSEPEADDDDGGINLDFTSEEETAAEAELDAEEVDIAEKAVAELRADLRSKFGDWYVIHTYSGMENRVQQNLENRVSSLNMEEFIFEVRVPTEEVDELRNGQKKRIKRTVLPGYVLVRMELTDESWSTVRHTPSVTGFVGHSNQPIPLSLEEVEKMLAPAIIAAAQATADGGQSRNRAKKKIEVADFSVGDSVMVVEGPFAGVHATITEMNLSNQRVRALVEILGRETPVDLTFPQIQRT